MIHLSLEEQVGYWKKNSYLGGRNLIVAIKKRYVFPLQSYLQASITHLYYQKCLLPTEGKEIYLQTKQTMGIF